jgi:hypothetical protein
VVRRKRKTKVLMDVEHIPGKKVVKGGVVAKPGAMSAPTISVEQVETLSQQSQLPYSTMGLEPGADRQVSTAGYLRSEGYDIETEPAVHSQGPEAETDRDGLTTQPYDMPQPQLPPLQPVLDDEGKIERGKEEERTDEPEAEVNTEEDKEEPLVTSDLDEEDKIEEIFKFDDKSNVGKTTGEKRITEDDQ